MTGKHSGSFLIALVTIGSLVSCSRATLPTSPGPIGAPPTSFVLSGVVDAGSEGNGVEGVEVTVSGGGPDDAEVGRQTFTDADGRFSLSGLGAGSWRVTLKKRGFADYTTDVTLNGDITLRFSLLITSAAAPAAALRP